MITSFDELRAAARARTGCRVVIVAPHSSEILLAARQADDELGVDCILVGDREEDPCGCRHRAGMRDR